MCVYGCLCMCVCMYVCMYVWVWVYVCVYVCIIMCVYMYVMYTCMYSTGKFHMVVRMGVGVLMSYLQLICFVIGYLIDIILVEAYH